MIDNYSPRGLENGMAYLDLHMETIYMKRQELMPCASRTWEILKTDF